MWADKLAHYKNLAPKQQKFSPKTTNFKSKTLRSTSYRGMDKI